MITQSQIESAYENMRRAEEARYDAAEEEIQARMMCESLKAIEVKFRSPDYQEEWDKRETAWWQAEHDNRVAIHLYKMAKWEILKNRDLIDLANLEEDLRTVSDSDTYCESDVAARNLKSVRAPKKKTIWGN